MGFPRRIKDYAGRHALVDGIPYTMPINASKSDALMAGFTCDFEAARQCMPDPSLHPVRVSKSRAVFIATVVNYVQTDIGKYIEYSLALACHRGRKPALPLMPALMLKWYKTGQFILDLPVSSEVSVKGGKGIWGMPKHKANLDFIDHGNMVSSQYEKDGQFAFRVEITKPKRQWIPLRTGAVNYAKFRNQVMASYVYFKTKAGVSMGKNAQGALYIGDHPRTAFMRNLGLAPKPFFTTYLPQFEGILDDYYEGWFCTYDKPQTVMPEGMESVVNLGLSEEWLSPPAFTEYEKFKVR